jgi:hypothetical protein
VNGPSAAATSATQEAGAMRLSDTFVSTSFSFMLGTDYPFGEWKPVEFVQSATRIPEAMRREILGANAARVSGS